MIHDIRAQAWGHDPVLVCRTCTREVDGNTVGTVLARTDRIEGLAFAEIKAAIEHHTGEAAFRASRYGTQVEGQTTFGPNEYEERLATEEDLVAFGNEPEHGPGYHPRTGQRIDGGPSLKEFLQSKGEM